MGGGTPKVKLDKTNIDGPGGAGVQDDPMYTRNMISGLGLGSGITDMAIRMAPEIRERQVDTMQRGAAREAEINALKSRALEERMDPRLAEVRRGLTRQTAEDLEGGPSKELSNMWLKQGLSDVISTGANLRSGFARSALADRSREDYYANRAASQDRAARLLAANPMQLAGLDPGQLASYESQLAAENANARDAYRAQILSMMGNQSNNTVNAFQQFGQMDAARKGQNAQLKAQQRSQNLQAENSAAVAGEGNKTALMGAGIGAAGALAGAAIIF
jgi:hypothetical protein